MRSGLCVIKARKKGRCLSPSFSRIFKQRTLLARVVGPCVVRENAVGATYSAKGEGQRRGILERGESETGGKHRFLRVASLTLFLFFSPFAPHGCAWKHTDNDFTANLAEFIYTVVEREDLCGTHKLGKGAKGAKDENEIQRSRGRNDTCMTSHWQDDQSTVVQRGLPSSPEGRT